MIDKLQQIVNEHQCQEHTFPDGSELLIDVQTANVITKVLTSLPKGLLPTIVKRMSRSDWEFNNVAKICWGATKNG